MQRGKLTPNSNVRWEASRMMLPEHREAIVQARKEWGRNPSNLFPDEDVQMEWSGQLNRAWKRGHRVRLVRRNVKDEQALSGKIRALDPVGQRLELWLDCKGKTEGETEVYVLERLWVDWNDLLSFEVIG